jgi:putative transcriptional regulator
MAKKTSKLSEALLETAQDMHSAGLMDDDSYKKITVRHWGPDAPLSAEPITPEEIRRVRARASEPGRACQIHQSDDGLYLAA